MIFVKKLFLKIDLADLEALQCLQVLPAVGLVYSGIAGLDCLPPPAGPGSSLPSPTFWSQFYFSLWGTARGEKILPHLTGQIRSGWEQGCKIGIMVTWYESVGQNETYWLFGLSYLMDETSFYKANLNFKIIKNITSGNFLLSNI